MPGIEPATREYEMDTRCDALSTEPSDTDVRAHFKHTAVKVERRFVPPDGHQIDVRATEPSRARGKNQSSCR